MILPREVTEAAGGLSPSAGKVIFVTKTSLPMPKPTIKIALSRPELFAFAGALAPRSMCLFGAGGSDTRHCDNPFLIARSANASAGHYLFLTCGADESLLLPNRDFATVSEKQHLPHEFHVVPGGHRPVGLRT